MKKSRGGRMTAAKARAAKRKGWQGSREQTESRPKDHEDVRTERLHLAAQESHCGTLRAGEWLRVRPPAPRSARFAVSAGVLKLQKSDPEPCRVPKPGYAAGRTREPLHRDDRDVGP